MFTDYTTSQKAVLIEEVRLLSRKLGRPVCSKDLLKHWEEKPERRPLLTQPVGQLLIKASRRRGKNPLLHKCGIIGNVGFYAADEHPAWSAAFRRHEIVLRAQVHARWAVPEHAVFLLGTEHEALAMNALAGFVEEWAKVAEDRSIVLPKRMHDLLETSRKESPGRFSGKCPELVSRERAEEILVEEMADRNPFFEDSTSLHRHLSILRWPLSSLFSQTGYWEEQVRLYCSARWPLDDDDPMVARARWLCGVYGNEVL